MSARNTKTVTISLPPQLVTELDRVREREHRTPSEILREALRRYIAVAERDCMIPVEDALPEEIEDHTCRHSPAVPAAATTLCPLPLLDIAEFELVRC